MARLPGTGGGPLPVLPTGHGLGEALLSLLVQVEQGPIEAARVSCRSARSRSPVLLAAAPSAAARVASSASVEGPEPGQPQLLSDVRRCPGGLSGVAVAEQPQPTVGHGADVGAADRAEGGERLIPVGPLVRCLTAGFRPIGSSGWQ